MTNRRPVRAPTGPPLSARISPELTAAVLVLFVTLPLGLFIAMRASAAIPAGNGGATPSAAASAAMTSIAPSATPKKTRAPTASPNQTIAKNALEINSRLAVARASLRTLVAERPVNTSAIASTLRDINATINAGHAYATALAAQRSTATIGEELLAIYDEIHDLTAATLSISLHQTDAYVDGARDVASEISNLATADQALEDLDRSG